MGGHVQNYGGEGVLQLHYGYAHVFCLYDYDVDEENAFSSLTLLYYYYF